MAIFIFHCGERPIELQISKMLNKKRMFTCVTQHRTPQFAQRQFILRQTRRRNQSM